jgi:hypothetical protein
MTLLAFRRRFVTAFACKALFLATCCVFVLDGRHPPVKAQQLTEPASLYGVELQSAVQRTIIDTMVKRQDLQDEKIAALTTALNANTNAISGSQGETRGLVGGLGLLQVLIGILVYRKKSTE